MTDNVHPNGSAAIDPVNRQTSPNGKVEDPDPFDPGRFRISQDFANNCRGQAGADRDHSRQARKRGIVRVHPSPDYRLDVAVVKYRAHGLFGRPRAGKRPTPRSGEFGHPVHDAEHAARDLPVPVPLPKEGRSNSWTTAPGNCPAIKAMSQTLQIKANHNPKAARYDAAVPIGKPPEPEWPDVPFRDLLRLAFGNNVINPSYG